MGTDAYYWCLFRWLYNIKNINGVDKSDDGLWHVHTVMNVDIWKTIQRRRIPKMHLVICDDVALDADGKEWLVYLNGKQSGSSKEAAPISGLTHPYSATNPTGASAHLCNIVQDIMMIPTRLRTHMKVYAHTSNVEAGNMYSGKSQEKHLIKIEEYIDGKKPQAVKYAQQKVLNTAFPMTANGRQKGMIFWWEERGAFVKNQDKIFDMKKPPSERKWEYVQNCDRISIPSSLTIDDIFIGRFAAKIHGLSKDAQKQLRPKVMQRLYQGNSLDKAGTKKNGKQTKLRNDFKSVRTLTCRADSLRFLSAKRPRCRSRRSSS